MLTYFVEVPVLGFLKEVSIVVVVVILIDRIELYTVKTINQTDH